MTLSRLPLLEPHQETLEKCVYCPKLSRAACPVSNVEASETVTPWGKMSMAYFAGRGDVPSDPPHAATAWACSACYACRERCDHKNEVADVLTDARAEFFARGVAPAGARAVAEGFAAHEAETARATREVLPEGDPQGLPFLAGCGYVRKAPEAARAAFRATRALTGRSLRPIERCCGLPLLHAGDREGFRRAARALAAEIGEGGELLVVDPGCALAIERAYPREGVPAPRLELFVDLVHRERGRLRPGAFPGPARYHDPCQLGRGLGRYDEPRAILERVTGERPAEFLRAREHAECSGGGGLLPKTRPESSRMIADARLAEHGARGGGLLVTACASSLVRFRSRGERALDLAEVVASALP